MSAGDAAAARAAPPGAIDGAQLRSILRVSLWTSLRVGGRLMGGRRRPRGLIFLLVMYALLGGFAGALAFMRVDLFTWALVLQAMTLFSCGGSLVAESPNLLFSLQEQDVLGHRPIDARTLLLARVLRVVLFAAILAFALNALPIFFSLAARGATPWAPLAHAVTVAVASAFCTAFVVFAYVILTRLVGRERFDGIATWTQVAVSVLFIAGYQIVPRLLDRAQGLHVNPALPFLWLLPPAWFAALEAVLSGVARDPRMLAMAAAGVVVPGLLLWAAVTRLAGGYAERLASLSETPARPRAARRGGAASAKTVRMNPILRAWMPDPIERSSFRLAAAYMRRDRDARMRLYPSLATILVFPLLPLLDPHIGAMSGPVIALMLAGTVPLSAMLTLRMSPHWAAADVFRYTPIHGTASIFHGVRKATLLNLMLPAVAAVATILWFTLKSHERMLALLPTALVLPTLSLFLGLTGDYLPLSMAPVPGRQAATNLGVTITSMLASAVITAAGEVARRQGWLWWLVGLELALLIPLHLMLLRGIRVRALVPQE